MSLFIPITKVDVEQRLVYGTLSAEVRYRLPAPESLVIVFDKFSKPSLPTASGGGVTRHPGTGAAQKSPVTGRKPPEDKWVKEKS